MENKTMNDKASATIKEPYEPPRFVSLSEDGDKNKSRGCKNGNQIEGDCTTGGYPKGNMADCRNGAYANDENSSCQNGTKPTIT